MLPLRRTRQAAAAATTLTLLAGLVAPTATGSTPDPGPLPAPAAADRVQQQLDSLVSSSGFPGAIATVRDAQGEVRTYTTGTGDLRTGAPVPTDSQVRIASNTKMFTAVVVLQLVGESRVRLDAPVERYLPGIVRGHGNDGRKITVRNLLQQTSGLPDYDSIVTDGGGDLRAIAHTYFEPRQLVDSALGERRHFKPGAEWEYSNTNYILLGLLTQRVTGRPIGELITQHIIEPLGLEDTYWPEAGEQVIRGTHPHGYLADGPDGGWRDITDLDPSLGWAAGQLVSTPGDLGRFMQALLGGELLQPAQQAQLTRTVAAPDFDPDPGWRYGLGIARTRLDCGPVAWGHGGDIQGFETRNLVTDDGRWAVVTVTGLPSTLQMVSDVDGAVESILCAV
ncbi:serine hydrolase domain-containing protein [Nocardioides sp. T2.26MG-1]|uniref:serine hydrolase domain-containing protein n=1 Tax=Nocardioides sp. T2.26MG-1 TaxID=3041166 RepID=UPI002477A3E2|nr:serine hydrolase domain-containing protein [Nocardioides sp. T2.26MG-1]CAI9413552.1 D-alanyl-D-alanine carboxypeptidase [Nocardioides sp. T2.26MG-1]